MKSQVLTLHMTNGTTVAADVMAGQDLQTVIIQTLVGRFYFDPQSMRQFCRQMLRLLEARP